MKNKDPDILVQTAQKNADYLVISVKYIDYGQKAVITLDMDAMRRDKPHLVSYGGEEE